MKDKICTTIDLIPEITGEYYVHKDRLVTLTELESPASEDCEGSPVELRSLSKSLFWGFSSSSSYILIEWFDWACTIKSQGFVNVSLHTIQINFVKWAALTDEAVYQKFSKKTAVVITKKDLVTQKLSWFLGQNFSLTNSPFVEIENSWHLHVIRSWQ